MKLLNTIGVCVLAFSLAACSSDKPADLTAESKTGASDTNAPVLRELLNTTQQVNGAKSDLAVRAGLDENDILVKQASAVTWGSSALGCPEKGMNYTQAAVPGLLVILESAGKQFRYHGRKGHPLMFCPNKRAQAPAYGPGEEVI
jgi:hypothetical protein